jgi:hypothetical protein
MISHIESGDNLSVTFIDAGIDLPVPRHVHAQRRASYEGLQNVSCTF